MLLRFLNRQIRFQFSPDPHIESFAHLFIDPHSQHITCYIYARLGPFIINYTNLNKPKRKGAKK